MQKRLLVIVMALALPAFLLAQATHVGTSGTLPASCRVGDVYYKTGTSAGLYACTATNTWTLSAASSVTTTGSPASGNLTKFSGAGSITNADLTGDVTTSGGVATTLATVPIGKGGTGLTSAADDQTIVSSGSAWVAKTLPDCTDTGGNHLNYTQSSNAFSCGTSGGGGGGNVTSTSAYASPPGSPSAGDLWYPTDSVYSVLRYSGSAWVPFPYIDPTLQSWSWVNQGTGTVSSANGGVVLVGEAHTGSNSSQLRVKSAPSTPYTITAAFQWIVRTTSGSQWAGLIFRNSSSGKFTAHALTVGNNLRISAWDSPTTFNSDYLLSALYGSVGSLIWLQISDDGTNRIYRYSGDGRNWIQAFSQGRTTFFTADQVGFFVTDSTNIAPVMTLLSWKES